MDSVSQSVSHSVIDDYQPVLATSGMIDRPLLAHGLAERQNSINFHSEPESTASANFWWSTFNLWNDILSSNIVCACLVDLPGSLADRLANAAVPYFVMSLGLWLTLPVFIIYGMLTGSAWCRRSTFRSFLSPVHTLDAVYKLSSKYRKKSYVELCHFALGKPGYISACFFIFLFNYGTLVCVSLNRTCCSHRALPGCQPSGDWHQHPRDSRSVDQAVRLDVQTMCVSLLPSAPLQHCHLTVAIAKSLACDVCRILVG